MGSSAFRRKTAATSAGDVEWSERNLSTRVSTLERNSACKAYEIDSPRAKSLALDAVQTTCDS